MYSYYYYYYYLYSSYDYKKHYNEHTPITTNSYDTTTTISTPSDYNSCYRLLGSWCSLTACCRRSSFQQLAALEDIPRVSWPSSSFSRVKRKTSAASKTSPQLPLIALSPFVVSFHGRSHCFVRRMLDVSAVGLVPLSRRLLLTFRPRSSRLDALFLSCRV